MGASPDGYTAGEHEVIRTSQVMTIIQCKNARKDPFTPVPDAVLRPRESWVYSEAIHICRSIDSERRMLELLMPLPRPLKFGDLIVNLEGSKPPGEIQLL
jgi:hypothetical protein